MKIRKTAEQRNFKVDVRHYTSDQMDALIADGVIEDLNERFNCGGTHYVVYAVDCKEVKVACVDGYYQTVAVTKNDITVFVEL